MKRATLPLCVTLTTTLLAACDAPEDAPLPAPPETLESRAVHEDSLGQPMTETASAAIAGNEAVELDAHLLARVEVQPGEVVEFYEPAPGVILVSGAGRPAGEVIVDAELVELLDTRALWDHISDGDLMPEALEAAVQRAEERRGDPPSALAHGDDTPLDDDRAITASASVPAAVDAGPVEGEGYAADSNPVAAGWCDSGYFNSSLGACPSGYGWQMCLNNWWNGAWAEHHDARYAYTNVCPADGNVTLKVYFENGGGGIWTVNQNYYRWWAGSDWDCEVGFDFDCPRFRMDVLNAGGDRFHSRVFMYF